MRKLQKFILLFTSLCLLLCGCTPWMDGSYASVKDHVGQGGNLPAEDIEVSSYAGVCNALIDLVENHRESGIIYFSGFDPETAAFFMETALDFLRHRNPLFVYALEDLSYDIGIRSGRSAIAIDFRYSYTRAELQQIPTVYSTEQLISTVTSAVRNYDSSTVLRVKNYKDIDFVQLVRDFVDQNPQLCMEMPQVSAVSFPSTGVDRIIQLSFTYQTSHTTLREMQEAVNSFFTSAKLYVSSDADVWQQYSQLYSFLMERFHYTTGTSITPTYHLLNHGIGNPKAFATVYAAMCRQAGLDCHFIVGTRNSEPWYWNVLLVDGVYYHIDLMACMENDGFCVYTAEEMTNYIWAYTSEILHPLK